MVSAGVEHDICGLALTVRFIPPSAETGSSDQAFLVARPIGGGEGGDQPAPGMVAAARLGQVAVVLGRRFRVELVDPARSRVRLRMLCADSRTR